MKRRGIIKRLLPQTLLGRSLMILIVPILLLQVMTTFIFFDRHWTRMSARLAFAVAGEISVIADQIESGGDDPQKLNRIAGYAAQNLDLLVSFEPGATLVPHEKNFTGWQTLVAEILATRLDDQVRRPFDIVVGSNEKWIEISIQLENGLLRVSAPQSRLFSTSGYIFLMWMVGISSVLMFIAVLFMRNQIRPIRRLALAAERFGKGRDVAAFKPEGAREVRQAAKAFLEMHDRIKRQIAQRTAMLAGVSHDLRTPLTRLRLEIAMLGDGPEIEACKDDINGMQKMIDGYLDFVRGDGDEQIVKTDLRGLLEKVVANTRHGAAELQLSCPANIVLSVKPMAMARCFDNIVSNACKYASHVWIDAAKGEEDMVTITVDDDGPGVPEDLYESVFRPFFRVDDSRNAATGGVGLGLPIAMDIVHGHGGRIWLEKSPQGGLRVRITLPQ